MKFHTINPATEEVIDEYELMPKEKVLSQLKKSHSAFNDWKNIDVSKRAQYSRKLAQVLRNKKN